MRYRSLVLPALGAVLSIALLIPGAVAAPGAFATTATSPSIMAALGDSITRASSADGTGGDNLGNSWSTGNSSAVSSHRTRIVASTGATPATYNLAQGGSESSDLPRQATLAVARSADYVTIMSGANNVCHADTPDELPTAAAVRADFATALLTLNAGLPNAKIFVASIPSLYSLYLAARDSSQARTIWEYAGVCPVMLADPLDQSAAAQSRRAAVESRVDQLNAAIAAACDAASRCTHDDNAVNDMPVVLGDVSTRDYFHPSIAGQTKIAAATWKKVDEKGVFREAVTAPVRPPRITTVDDTSSQIDWSGTWATTAYYRDNGGSVSYLKVLGSGYSLTFTGTGVSIEARTTPSSGISEVQLDGILVGKIDGYSESTSHRQVVFESRKLSPGTHTLSVTSTSDKSPSSSGRNAILDALIVEDAS